MTKVTTPAPAGTEKTRKPRAPKPITHDQVAVYIGNLEIAEKIVLRNTLNDIIEEDRKRLQGQLNLINGTNGTQE